MKKFISFGLTAIALIFVFNILAVTETKAQAQGPINEILKRMDEHQKALKSLQANVVMDKYNAQLDEHDMTEGSLMYLPRADRDAAVRIDWVKPVEETLAVIDKKYVVYRPRLRQALTGKVDDKNKSGQTTSALAFMSMSKEQIKANYGYQYLGEETVSTGAQTWHLKLSPKTPSNFQYVEIWVDGNGMVIQAKIIEKNNDSTTVLLSNLQKNVTLDAKKFQVNIPKGTQVING